VHYRRPGDPDEHVGLACRLRGFEGMHVTRAAPEIRYNMSDALARPPRDEGAPAGPTRPPE